MNFDDFFRDSYEHAQMYQLARKTVLSVYPEAIPKLSHGMPAWKSLPKDGGKIFLYVAARPKHFGLYCKVAYIMAKRAEIEKLGFECADSMIRLPYSVDSEQFQALIEDICRFNLEKFRGM